MLPLKETTRVLTCILFVFLLVSGYTSTEALPQNTEILLQSGHADRITSVQFSPNGKYILSGSIDQTARVWDSKSGKLTRILKQPEGAIYTLAISQDSQLCVIDNGTIWNIETGEQLDKIDSDSRVVITAAAFSPDGDWIAFGSGDNTVRLWNLQERTLHSLGSPGEQVNSIAFNPDGRFLAFNTSHSVQVWHANSGEQIFHVSRKNPISWPNAAGDLVVFSPDGNSLASGGWGNQGTDIQIWQWETGIKSDTLKGHTDLISSLVYASDGSTLISGSRGGTITIWDIESKKSINSWKAHRDQYNFVDVDVHPNGKEIISSSFSFFRSIKRWDLMTGTLINELGASTDRIRNLVFSQDGKYLAIGRGGHDVRILDWETGAIVQQLLKPPDSESHGVSPPTLAFSPNGERLASTKRGEVIIWKWRDGKPIQTFSYQRMANSSPVAFTAGGTKLATIGKGPQNTFESILLWDVQTGKLVKSVSISGGALSQTIVNIEKENRLVVASGFVWTFNIKNGFVAMSDFVTDGFSHAISRNGKFVANSVSSFSKEDKDRIEIWRLKDNKLVQTFSGFYNDIFGMAFSHDEQLLAAAGRDKTIWVWDVTTGQLVQKFKGHNTYVNSLAFSPDGRYLASGGDDAQVKIWDLKTKKLIMNFVGFSNGEWVSYTPDNFYISSPKGDRYITARSGNKLYEFAQYSRIFNHPEIISSALNGENIKDHISAIHHETGIDPLQVRIGENRPPEITVKYLKQGNRLYEPGQPISVDKVDVVARIVERIDGISEIQATLNGKVIFEKKKIEKRDFQIPISLKLQEGQNEFELVAYSSNQVRSYAQTLNLNYQITKGPKTLQEWVQYIKGLLRQSKSWAVVIGVNDYKKAEGFDSLPYAVADAKAVKDLLVSHLGFAKDRVIMLENPTKQAMEYVLGDQLRRKVKEEDRVLVFFSGHGTTEKLAGDDMMGFLVPSDGKKDALYSTAISMDQIDSWSKRIPAKQILFIVDACYSGIAGAIPKKEKITLTKQTRKDVETFIRHGGRQIMTAGTDNEVTFMSKKWEGHSVYTYYLLEGLKGLADWNKDKIVTAGELNMYLKNVVPREADQSPQLVPLKGLGQFVFYPEGAF